MSAGIHIADKYRGMSMLSTIFKPLTTLLIFLYAYSLISQINLFSILILLGLVLSLFGDIFLLSAKRFTFGLLSFLLAHICYIIAFSLKLELVSWWVLLLVMLYACIYYGLLYRSLGQDCIAVAVYVVVIALMGWLAINVFINLFSMASFLLMLGAALFMLSDSALAWDRFKSKLKHEPSWVMISYYLAQYLIASATILLY